MITSTPQEALKTWTGDAMEKVYYPDIATEIDKEEEILAEELKCSIPIARKVMQKIKEDRENHAGNNREVFSRIISKLMESTNTKASLYGLACAGGLDALNGLRSQAEISRKHGVSRALISHYTVAWADYMSGKKAKFTITKLRKSEESRAVFKKKATNPFTEILNRAIKRAKNK
jgi:hypothetical protein